MADRWNYGEYMAYYTKLCGKLMRPDTDPAEGRHYIDGKSNPLPTPKLSMTVCTPGGIGPDPFTDSIDAQDIEQWRRENGQTR